MEPQGPRGCRENASFEEAQLRTDLPTCTGSPRIFLDFCSGIHALAAACVHSGRRQQFITRDKWLDVISSLRYLIICIWLIGWNSIQFAVRDAQGQIAQRHANTQWTEKKKKSDNNRSYVGQIWFIMVTELSAIRTLARLESTGRGRQRQTAGGSIVTASQSRDSYSPASTVSLECDTLHAQGLQAQVPTPMPGSVTPPTNSTLRDALNKRPSRALPYARAEWAKQHCSVGFFFFFPEMFSSHTYIYIHTHFNDLFNIRWRGTLSQQHQQFTCRYATIGECASVCPTCRQKCMHTTFSTAVCVGRMGEKKSWKKRERLEKFTRQV